MLREERTARIERIDLPARRPSWRQRFSDWLNESPPRPRTETLYEFSVGKYTFGTEVAKSWEFVRIPAAELARAAETQKVTPVLVMRNGYGKRWWWYLGRFYRESLGMTAGEVHEQVLKLKRARELEERRLLYERPAADSQTEADERGARASTNGEEVGSLEDDLLPSRRANAEAPSSAAPPLSS